MTRWRTRWAVAALAVLVAAVAGGRVSARASDSCAPGLSAFDVGGNRVLMRVAPAPASRRRALLLVLRDAGASEQHALAEFRGSWSTPGLVLLAPAARGSTWSFERGHGADLATVSQALTQAFARCGIDSRRVGIGGFGAGATSALSLGIRNGRLFHAIVALSPGSLARQARVGRPRVFVAHGTVDPHFATTRDMLVPTLRREGYPVTFRAFAGGHVVPAAVLRDAVRWFLRRRP